MRQFLKSWLSQFSSKRNSKQPLTLDEVIAQIIDEWPVGRAFRVDDVLAIYPELSQHSRAVIEFAIVEYNARIAAEESITPSQFAEQFPSIRSALLDSLLVDQAMTSLTGVVQRQRSEATKWPQVGETLANFHLLEQIGKGAFSRVFLAEDLTLRNRQVAVKFCRNDSYEIEALSQLQHSSIGVVLEVRDVPERNFAAISMQMQGRATLDSVIRHVWKKSGLRQRFPRTAMRVWESIRDAGHSQLRPQNWSSHSFSDWALQVAQLLASALTASHELDFVHCDIKPSNVLVTPEGKPILIDFNVSFRSDATHSPANIGGTLPYMAPEQVRAFAGRGSADVGPQTDLFGWGATLYQLLTGHLPFGTADSSADGIRALLKQREIAPKPIQTINPEIDDRFAEIVMKCLSYDPADRPRSAEAVSAELEQIQKARLLSANIKRTDRWRVGVAGSLAAAALVAISMGPFGRPGANPPPLLSVPGVPMAPAPIVAPDNSLRDLLTTAFEQLERGELPLAKLTFEKALQDQPKHEGAKLGLARTLTRLADSKAASKLLSEINWQSGEPTELVAFRGYHHLWLDGDLGAIDQASNLLDQARKMSPNDPATLTNLALCHLKNGRMAAAVPLLERARLQAPDRPEIAILLMRSYVNARASVGEYPTSAFDVAYVDELAQVPITRPHEFWDVAFSMGVISHGISDTHPQTAARLSRQAIQLFVQGCADSRFRPNWTMLSEELVPDVVKEAAAEFKELANSDAPAYGENSRTYSLDPLFKSRFGRTLQADLDSQVPMAISQR